MAVLRGGGVRTVWKIGAQEEGPCTHSSPLILVKKVKFSEAPLNFSKCRFFTKIQIWITLHLPPAPGLSWFWHKNYQIPWKKNRNNSIILITLSTFFYIGIFWRNYNSNSNYKDFSRNMQPWYLINKYML